MKVLFVNGSPHEKGCTYTALKEVADTLDQQGIATEIMWLGKKPLAGCMGCGACNTTGRCVFDDSVNDFCEATAGVDGFIFGTPVHFAAADGALTSFMDRAFFGGKAKVQGKPAAAVVSCRRGGASAAFDQVNKYFTIKSMPVVSSQYWNQVHGSTPADVRQDAEGLQTMRTLGNNMAWLLKCIDAGKKAGIPFPAPEATIYTNFIR